MPSSMHTSTGEHTGSSSYQHHKPSLISYDKREILTPANVYLSLNLILHIGIAGLSWIPSRPSFSASGGAERFSWIHVLVSEIGPRHWYGCSGPAFHLSLGRSIPESPVVALITASAATIGVPGISTTSLECALSHWHTSSSTPPSNWPKRSACDCRRLPVT